MARSLAVVGAGAAGLGAAHALAGTGVDVTLFEASDRVGGRAVTRRRRGCTYDTGANYIAHDARTTALLRKLGTDGLVDVREPVWTFDADGAIEPGDRQERHKWTYESGIAEFARRVLGRADTSLRPGARVDGLARRDGEWAVTVAGDDGGWFDGVLLTPPAPRTAALLDATAWDDGRLPSLREAAGAVPYRTIRTLVLHYPFAVSRPYYALVNTDRAHAVGWLAREGVKDGHVPDGEGLLIAQMAPEWSAARSDAPADEAAAEAADRVADLLAEDRLRDPDWTDSQAWRHALPDEGADADALAAAEPAGLFFAGDWVAGEGRVARAFWNGAAAGERIDDAL